MDRLIVLELEGDLNQQGFQARLEVGCDRTPRTEPVVRGRLPPNPALVECLQSWQESYEQLAISTRKIQPQSINYDGTIHPLEACRQSADSLKQELETWLQEKPFRDVEVKLRETLSQAHPTRILIRSASNQIAQLPWHHWECIDRSPQTEIAFSAPPSKPATTKPGVRRVLAILGDGSGINITADLQLLNQIPKAEVKPLVEPTREELNKYLWEQSWDILFFAGHGHTEETGRIWINPKDSLSLEELCFALRKAIDRGLQLAIFNSCDGLGLVPALTDLRLPNLIVMRHLLPDLVAQTFLENFLAAFSRDRPLHLAVREAREKLQGLENQFPCASWLPVLYVNPATVPLTWNPPLPARHDPRPLLLISLAVAFLVILARMGGSLQPLELWAYDFLMRHRLPEDTDPRILLVIIDQTEVSNQYPGKAKPGDTALTDKTAETLLQTINTYQLPPRVIALDIFREATSNDYPILKKALATDDRLIAICEPQSLDQRHYPHPPEITENLEERVGFSSHLADPGEIVRRALLFAHVNNPQDNVCPVRFSLGLLTALHYLASEGWQLDVQEENDQFKLVHQTGQEVMLKQLTANAGAYHNIDARGYQGTINYRASTEPFERVSLTNFLKNANHSWLKDRIILIGSSDPELGDVRLRTPLSPAESQPGVLTHAHIASQLISAALDGRPLLQPWPVVGDLLWIVGWSIAGGIAVWYCRRLGIVILTELTTLTFLSGSAWGLLMQGWWVPFVPPILAVSTTAIVCILYQRKQKLQLLLVNPQ